MKKRKKKVPGSNLRQVPLNYFFFYEELFMCLLCRCFWWFEHHLKLYVHLQCFLVAYTLRGAAWNVTNPWGLNWRNIQSPSPKLSSFHSRTNRSQSARSYNMRTHVKQKITPRPHLPCTDAKKQLRNISRGRFADRSTVPSLFPERLYEALLLLRDITYVYVCARVNDISGGKACARSVSRF